MIHELEGKLDIVVNAAGTLMSKTLKDTTLRDWDFVMNINVRTCLQLISLSSAFLKRTQGCVVNVSSTAGETPKPGSLVFSVSKACLNMLTECAALELAPYGVRINAVACGITDTKARMRQEEDPLTRQQNNAFVQEASKLVPLNKNVNKTEDVAETIL
eukprot:CAMPEP_0201281330 /NCGR_PEP_ID=MMETSP1317-20130820/2405_1 /ASSEMBLY_ACC=CAM_ASM_000770 /TAXON_ID=187299 /ORGANISM="Undescribed Undescribed, Strain Undescribed" /LENGTH=158 /DNA_ID=CAMNT_0047590911 /DNA_START=165 /DNA_END=641 /DNA_ORIENTATION=+